jgi:UDP-N-acetyl-D-galactosamine dehydrogenase
VPRRAKVIEKYQRDLNIALMNELAIIIDLMGIRSKDVFRVAAVHEVELLPHSPGLWAVNCIGVDPSYLNDHAEDSAKPAAGDIWQAAASTTTWVGSHAQ